MELDRGEYAGIGPGEVVTILERDVDDVEDEADHERQCSMRHCSNNNHCQAE